MYNSKLLKIQQTINNNFNIPFFKAYFTFSQFCMKRVIRINELFSPLMT